ncbi:Tapetum specific protein TAP35/TAP44 [Raphanus sativus]|uniref:Uncharacterized protein LOC108826783 n=1 Tax=Raphanus sativus TaxID=3726 RepID=A0A6J0L676_RAPSA|nr:uncharacterized protein LOC108826783 [Raphanus sativus]KAJ4878205.1 Tapetum specific protein TAP35/TAP44 [Raphanus sativus]
MSKNSKASSLCQLLLLLFLSLNSQPALSSRAPKPQSQPTSAQTIIDDDSSSMAKIDHAKSMIAGFFNHKFPIKGWPIPYYPPFTMVNPNIPTNPSGAQEESEKLPSPPSKAKKDGGNA